MLERWNEFLDNLIIQTRYIEKLNKMKKTLGKMKNLLAELKEKEKLCAKPTTATHS